MVCDNGNANAPAYNPGDLLTEKETADFLKLSSATLRNWRASRIGPATCRVGKRSIRYRFADLETFIAASTAEVA